MNPEKIVEFLSKQKWFVQINGVAENKGQIHFTNNGAIKKFGKEWCDKCLNEELVKTGVYKFEENEYGIALKNDN